MDTRELTLFFALTFALSWVIFFSVDHRGGVHPLFLLGIFAPGIVGTLLTWRAEGGAGVRGLLKPITRWDVAARWYVFAILYFATVKALAAVGARVIAGSWPVMTQSALLLPFAIAFSTPVQAGEEVGWRGYALPRLSKRFGLPAASVMLGMIWAVWHLPLFYIAGADTTGQSFPVYMAQVTGLSVAIAWLYARTNGSLLLVMLMHSSINQVTTIVPAGVVPSTHPWTFNASLLSWLTLLGLWSGAAYLLVRMPRELPN
jgi:membrane protease YdiL (CAAX protease family)